MPASNSAVSVEEMKKGLYMCSAVTSTRCGGDLEDDHVPTLLFTAGTALAALCLKRAVLASLRKQCWQVWWVFVLLNAILLVVLLTSMRSSSTPGHRKSQDTESTDDGERTPKKQRKRKLRRCSGPPPAAVESARGEREESVCQEKDGWSGAGERDAVQEDDQGAVYEELSDEELNERVETFIATFRQHLVSDARRR
ncbi:uncharacterized protein LOC115757466 [Rhodamnia argentea]|uniref:Uncharacterized protein LOC115757466 n=1 Tax=Rhodamnia argentea TaxID=178133 RepID=A0A8B8R4J7_9MYRT|nr:uncharacterized protein LOC115757466 [Rhodamnia argentea]